MQGQSLVPDSHSSQMLNRRLRRACEHVTKRWFPVNRGLLEKIRFGLAEGVYELDLGFLVSELKTDFALFTLCIRRLAGMLAEEGIKVPQALTPISLLQVAGIERIRSVICHESLDHSDHSLERMTPEQHARLREAMISASTAEVLSENNNVDPDVGFSVGLLRQLGHTLIAWNYPKTYSRAAAGIEPGSDLDVELAQALGFSPTLLAITLIRDWGLAEEINYALEDGKDDGAGNAEEQQTAIVGERLREICRVGEALARANDPDTYPEAHSDWEEAKGYIFSYLGTESLKVIQERIKKNCESYLRHNSEVFRGIDQLDPVKKINAHKRVGAEQKNQFLKYCPNEIRKKLTELYRDLDPELISRENINHLAKNIIPLAGFTGGCVYIIDPATNVLMPRLRIGQMRLLDFKNIQCTSSKTVCSPVAAAFYCSTPIMESALPQDGGLISYIAGVLGDKKRVGVLYLEMPDVSLRSTDSNRLKCFKALRQALNDCLLLS